MTNIQVWQNALALYCICSQHCMTPCCVYCTGLGVVLQKTKNEKVKLQIWKTGFALRWRCVLLQTILWLSSSYPCVWHELYFSRSKQTTLALVASEELTRIKYTLSVYLILVSLSDQLTLGRFLWPRPFESLNQTITIYFSTFPHKKK